MNRALLDPFVSADLPRSIQQFLEQDGVTVMRFNRHGNLLAVGSRNGRVFIWDFDTRTVATILGDIADVSKYSVVSLTFPAPGNASVVLVAHRCGLLRLFDTLTTCVIAEYHLDVQIQQMEAHPKCQDVVAVVPVDGLPFLLYLRKGRYCVVSDRFSDIRRPNVVITAEQSEEPLPPPEDRPPRTKNSFANKILTEIPEAEPCCTIVPLCADDDFQEDGKLAECAGASRKRSSFCVVFSRSGKHILRGGPSGLIRVFTVSTSSDEPWVQTKATVFVSAGRAAVRDMTATSSLVLINSQDKCMRLIVLDELVGEYTEQDSGVTAPRFVDSTLNFTEIVNKQQCKCAVFTADGEFVLGGMEGHDQRILVWRVQDGHLEVTLEGPKEGLTQLLWHPQRPVMVTIGSCRDGMYIWAKNTSENWSAFASQFQELEANEEYLEAEDEFDIKDGEDDEKLEEERERAEAEDVDVVQVEPIGRSSSDSEGEDTYFYVPAVPIPDDQARPYQLSDRLIDERVNAQQSVDEEDNLDEEQRGAFGGRRRRRPSEIKTRGGAVNSNGSGSSKRARRGRGNGVAAHGGRRNGGGSESTERGRESEVAQEGFAGADVGEDGLWNRDTDGELQEEEVVRPRQAS